MEIFICGFPQISLQCRRCRFDLWVRKIPWRRKWQPTPVVFPGKSHHQRSLVGYSPWSHKRVGHSLTAKQKQQDGQLKHFSASDMWWTRQTSQSPFHVQFWFYRFWFVTILTKRVHDMSMSQSLEQQSRTILFERYLHTSDPLVRQIALGWKTITSTTTTSALT